MDSLRQLEQVQVDAFTDRPFAGNPAAVVFLPDDVASTKYDSVWMQNVAAENNLAETAFIAPITTNVDSCVSSDTCHYNIRW